MFFDDWQRLGEIMLTAALIYVIIVVLLRITGKRTTSKMNNFDWIVTVAMGSMVATVILVDEVALIDGAIGIASLIILQFLVTWTAVRLPFFERLVKSSPRLLYYRGEFQRGNMRHERITEIEIISAVRGQGFTAFDEVLAVVMETNSDLTILPAEGKEDADEVLANVDGWEQAKSQT